MKSEERHKLESNVLAAKLAAWGEKLRPYTSGLMTAVAVLLLGYFALALWKTYGASRDHAAWDAYEFAVLNGDVDMKQLQRVAASDDHAGAKMQEWAYVSWADRQLRLAADQYLTNRDDANKRLTTIAAVYEQFATNASDPDVQNRARLGIARVSEMQGNLEDARKQYALVEGALREVAAKRMKALESKEVQATCEWLKTAKLPKRPAPGATGARPGFDAAVPDADASPSAPSGPRSLEDILGGLTTGSDEPARYSDPAAGDAEPAKDAEAPAEGQDAAPVTEAEPAAAPSESAASSESAPSAGVAAEGEPAATSTPQASGEAPPQQ